MATPYIGSKICLISKAEIRYEGILYTIDAKESTVALAKVRAFGTEDRKAETQFPALDEIFEYIIFKAGDIKEIRVCQPPISSVASDPAIVSHSMAPGPPASAPAPPEAGGLPGPSFGDFTGTPYAGHTPIFMGQPSFGLGLPPAPAPNANLVNEDTPTPIGFPTAKAESREQSLVEGSRTSSPDTPRQHERRNDNDEQRQRNPRNSGPSNYGRGGNGRYQNDNNGYGPPRDNYQRRNNGSGGYGHENGIPRNRNPNPNRGINPRGGGSRRPPNKEPLKFDEEFDFDKANLEFQELESKMAKTKISDGDDVENEWEGEDEQPEETKNTSSEKENHEERENTDEFYNKSKSFFDKISCEALEREKGTNSGRIDWRHERTINKETFGVAAPPNRSYRRWQGGYNNDYNNGPRPNYLGGGGHRGGNRNGGYYNNGPRNYDQGQRNYHNNYSSGGYGGYGNHRGYDNRNRNNAPRNGPPHHRGPRNSQQQEA